MTRHGDAFYAGTTAGLFRLKTATGLLPQFERVEGVNSTLYGALKPYGTDLLAATDLGCFSRIGQSRRAESLKVTRPVFDLSASLRDPNTVYVARRTAVTALTRHGSAVDQRRPSSRSPGEEFRTVLEDADGRVWATTKGNIWRFDFRSGSRSPASARRNSASRRACLQGWVNARRLNGHVVFATARGLKRLR